MFHPHSEVATALIDRSYIVPNHLFVKDATCFIVDDICDGGGTFIGTAAMLKSKGAAKVVLIVSHGIFSKGERLEGIDEIFSTDSFRSLEGVHCFQVGEYL